MTSIFVNHSARYQVGERVYVLITLPEQQRAAWTEGHIVSEEVWKNTISSNGEPSPRHWYSVNYHVGQNSAVCNSSPSHGNILPREEWARKLIINSGGQWLGEGDV
ncbi:hypothetical protein PIIN_05977 [Serendipita indica DSM 11827]|uniref:Uncharacterized protein n=1 Tax=Serendipita indica (strain DSM 11827) TaxID=1109443 RepID=G4TL44_SERID|nr:hypothetical protein PIIN_05977 [Serendipita indica DSM 11827]